ALARDLHHVTLAALARDLDLALGTGSGEAEAPDALVQILDRLAEAEDDIMGRPLADFTVRSASAGGDTVTAVPISREGR
ncbi:MAG TPA: hypothetical protein VK844_05485, partial [Hyphomicrobiales bacterium]|nr:hypothetical protein [Hyphomicrobiales bacterium]